MSYNNLNLYKRVAEMQKVVLEIQKQHPGLPYTTVYRDYIRDQFHISYSTFNRWLGVPAKRELEKLNN